MGVLLGSIILLLPHVSDHLGSSLNYTSFVSNVVNI